jgi:hypothetical protein
MYGGKERIETRGKLSPDQDSEQESDHYNTASI